MPFHYTRPTIIFDLNIKHPKSFIMITMKETHQKLLITNNKLFLHGIAGAGKTRWYTTL